MGKVILCTGKEAERAYEIQSVGVSVTSMEELCYIVYHNIFVMQEELFSESLITFIEKELELPERAAYLKRLWESHAGTKDMAVALFCSTDYYDEQEIKAFLASYDAFYSKNAAERKLWLANRRLSEKKLRDAQNMYLEMLESGESDQLSDEEMGQLLHNLAVTQAHAGNLVQAAQHFIQAYRKNHAEDSLRQYLMALKLSGQEEAFRQELTALAPRRELLDRMTQEIYMARESAEQTADFRCLEKLQELRRDGNIPEYYQKLEQLLCKLKNDYRRQ